MNKLPKIFLIFAILISFIFIFPPPLHAAAPSAVPTFHCLGISWSPSEGSSDKTAQVEYRTTGTSTWYQALPLWFDARDNEYRGSIVNLTPGTTYEVKLTLQGTGTNDTFTATTWSEHFPIMATQEIDVSQYYGQTYRITEPGSAQGGYILYIPKGTNNHLNANFQQDYNIEVNASYIIIRGFKFTGGKSGAIQLQSGHNIIIEQNEITNWDDGHDDWDAAIRANSAPVNRVVIQRNTIHDPYDTSKTWDDDYPNGPHAIRLSGQSNTYGNFVIRYNDIYASVPGKYTADTIGLNGYNGNSDIYGNFISHSRDNPTETDGSDNNLRIWGNFMTSGYAFVSFQPLSDFDQSGPAYVWRNIIGEGEDYRNGSRTSRFVKGKTAPGAVYIVHNTLLQSNPGAGLPSSVPQGVTNGIRNEDSGSHYFVRNNILMVDRGAGFSIRASGSTQDSFDYDLFNGSVPSGHESNGIEGIPIYAGSNLPYNPSNPLNQPGTYFLDPSSPGYDQGEIIPNFNDNYTGSGPDIGAYEADTPPLEFGVNAYLNGPPMPTIPTSQITAKNLLTAYGTPSSYLDRIIDGLINLLDYTQLVTY